MMIKRTTWGGAVALSMAIAIAACGAGDADSNSSAANGNGATNGSGGGSGVGGASSTDVSISVAVGSGGGAPGLGCSADLQSVVDGNGIVVETCPPDQGCYEGQCVPACDAARNSTGTIGCDYLLPTPPFLQNESPGSTFDGTCFAVLIANSWGRPANISLTYDGQTYPASQFGRIPSGIGPSTQYAPVPATGIPAGEVAVLFVAHKVGANHPIGASLECPVQPAVVMDTAIHNSGRGLSFQVESDTPVTAYDMLPFGGSGSFLPSAALLFPSSSWGDNYVAYAPHALGGGSRWISVTASANNTQVELLSPLGMPNGPNVPQLMPQVPATVTLSRGETIQWMGGDPSGTVIQASAPVGVYTGHTYLRVTSAMSNGGGQDSAHQQLPPVGALGSQYVAGGVVSRRADLAAESTPYQLVGVVDGTQLSYEPAVPAGAPTVLGAGEVVEFESTDFFVVSAQDDDHPFGFTHYLAGTGGQFDRGGCAPNGPLPGCNLGDEEWVIIPAPAQYLQRYVFFVDPTYGVSNLVLTREAVEGVFSDVEISCLGNVSGWQDVGTSGQFQVAHVELIRGAQGVVPACTTSQHEAVSDGPFGIMVWGTDHYASYGYPAGGNIGSINSVVVPPTPN